MARREGKERKKGEKHEGRRQTVIILVFLLFNFMLQISSVVINRVGEEMVYSTFSLR